MSVIDSIPEHWVRAEIAEINAFRSANVTPAEWPDEVFELYSVPAFPTGRPEYLAGAEIKSSKQCVSADDVLLCKINPRINRVWQVSGETGKRQIASSEWIVIRQPLLHPKFLRYFLSELGFRNLLCSEVSGVGGSLTRAQPKRVAKYQIPVAPYAEQKQIAAKLDGLLAQVDTIKARLDAIPAILKRFRQSVLAAAVSGRLTQTWRGTESVAPEQSPVTIEAESNNAPAGWKWQKLTDLAVLESGHTPRKSIAEYWEGGEVYWISLQDIRAAHGTVIQDTKFKPTMLGIDNSSARLLPPGTVCFSRDISVGFTTIMGKEMSTTQHFANWICGERLNNRYLMYSLMRAKEHLTTSGQGTTVRTIYMPALKQFRLLTPPLEEQLEIVRRVDQLFAFADQLEQRLKTAQARVDHLTQSILAKAFRGELTAEWRAQNADLISGENSAEALLARIKAERETGTQKKRRTRKRATA